MQLVSAFVVGPYNLLIMKGRGCGKESENVGIEVRGVEVGGKRRKRMYGCRKVGDECSMRKALGRDEEGPNK